MADIYSLTIRADTRDVTRAKQALDGMSSGAIKATKSTDNLAGVYSRLDKIIELTAKGQKNAASVTATLAMEITKASQRVQALTGAQEESERQSRRQFDLFEQLRDGTIRLSAATGQYSTEYERLLRQINPAFRASQDFRRAVEILDAELARGTISLAQYNDSLRRLQGASTAVVRRGFAPMRGAIQQAGFQVGDFAVQVGAGQNALVAFAQQGSQLAGIFGPGGAVIGAIIAIGGAIAGGLVRSFGQGEDAAEDLSVKMRELAQELGEVSQRQRQIINTSFAQEIAEQTRRIEEQREVIFDNNREMETFVRRLSEQEAEALRANGTFDKWTDSIESARNQIAISEATIAATRKEQTEFWKEIDKSSESADTSTDSQRRLKDELRQQAEALKIAQAEVNEYWKAWEAVQKVQDKIDPIGADLRQFGQDVAVIQDAFARGIITDEQADQMVNSLNKVGEASKASGQGLEMFTQSQQTALGAVGQIFGNMAEIAEKGGKDQFDTWKAMASAQAAVNTALAISNALAIPPPPVGIALASTIGALGAVQVAQIQATEYQGARQMGGSVSAGGRYLVGENGPEIVTMGGSGVVTPSSVTNRGGDTNITQVLQVPGNIQQEVKQQIMAAMPLIRNTAINAVSTEINRGGNMARQVGRRP